MQSNNYTSTNSVVPPMVERVLLPTQVIEKPLAVHEEIRREQVEEIQPVISIEKQKTEIHQVTQPLFDKEIKAVNLEQRTLAPEILPEIHVQGRGIAAASDVSTVSIRDTAGVVIEKPAIYNEIEKTQIIEEIQPVLYKETIVPTVIQETKPVYQKIVEGPQYSQEVLAPKDLSVNVETSFVSRSVEAAPTLERVVLPVQVIEKPLAVHEEIRREQVEEIQPIINIEKQKTEIHQVTQPLFDKEVRPVNLMQQTLAPETLPEIHLQGRGIAAAADVSTVNVTEAAGVVVEKPAIVREVEKLRIIEEIQPVLYKETIVPTVIQETKPIYQKIIEGPVYSSTTLPARSIKDTHYTYTSAPLDYPVVLNTSVPVAPIHVQTSVPLNRAADTLIKETTTTTTTTVSQTANMPATPL